jgi:hypothetical protein
MRTDTGSDLRIHARSCARRSGSIVRGNMHSFSERCSLLLLRITQACRIRVGGSALGKNRLARRCSILRFHKSSTASRSYGPARPAATGQMCALAARRRGLQCRKRSGFYMTTDYRSGAMHRRPVHREPASVYTPAVAQHRLRRSSPLFVCLPVTCAPLVLVASLLLPALHHDATTIHIQCDAIDIRSGI